MPIRASSRRVSRFAVRAASLIFLMIVTVCFVAPFVQTLVPIFPNLVPPLEERRQPSPFPSPRLLLGVDGEFASRLNAWFDDRVGFRDLFIRSKNQIDYSLFRTSRKVYVGRDGWLFDRDPADPLAYLTPAQMAALEQSFVSLADMLAKRGIRLIVVGYPNKLRLYPEMAAPGQPLPGPNDNVVKLRQFLASRIVSPIRRCRSDPRAGEIANRRDPLQQDRYPSDRSRPTAGGQGDHCPHRSSREPARTSTGTKISS